MTDRIGLEEAIRQAANPVVLMQRVADEAMSLIKSVEGAAVGFVHDPPWLTFECATGHLKEEVDYRVPIEGSLSGLAFKTGETLRCDDSENDPRVALETCRRFHIVSSVCVPLWRGNQTVGVFVVISLGRRRLTTAPRRHSRALPGSSASSLQLPLTWRGSPTRCSPGPGTYTPGAAVLHGDDTRAEKDGSSPTS